MSTGQRPGPGTDRSELAGVAMFVACVLGLVLVTVAPVVWFQYAINM